jgi:hypothetical protein
VGRVVAVNFQAGPPYFFPSCRAASASIGRSAVELTDSLTRTFIEVSRLSDFGFFIRAF